jgi:hypothetical protein
MHPVSRASLLRNASPHLVSTLCVQVGSLAVHFPITANGVKYNHSLQERVGSAAEGGCYLRLGSRGSPSAFASGIPYGAANPLLLPDPAALPPPC